MFNRRGPPLARETDAASSSPTLEQRRGDQPCSEAHCRSVEAVRCSYTDRRQRHCATAWCRLHHQVAFNDIYCRRHAGVIRALGVDWPTLPLPDLDNRAPSLANWISSELDGSVRNLLERFSGPSQLLATTVVSGGTAADRRWGRAWKLVSTGGVDVSVAISVAEADDSVVRLTIDGRVLTEMVPPWIEARRHGITLDRATDASARRDFHSLLLDDLERALQDVRTERLPWSERARSR